MIAEKMKPYVKNNSAIRMMFEEGNRLRAIYGPENVFDFSLGNPSVPAPDCVRQAIIDLVNEEEPTAVSYTHLDVYKRQVVVFTMITAQKIKTNGFGGYMKGFTTPIPIMTPFNILSEIATPISMACRHFGNILSGVVINGLIYAALALASSKLFGLIPGIVGDVLSKIPFLDVGIPAIMSVYFDWFSGIMQAFIFCMLTVMYIANAAEE